MTVFVLANGSSKEKQKRQVHNRGRVLSLDAGDLGGYPSVMSHVTYLD